jgi:hypothetical protein
MNEHMNIEPESYLDGGVGRGGCVGGDGSPNRTTITGTAPPRQRIKMISPARMAAIKRAPALHTEEAEVQVDYIGPASCPDGGVEEAEVHTGNDDEWCGNVGIEEDVAFEAARNEIVDNVKSSAAAMPSITEDSDAQFYEKDIYFGVVHHSGTADWIAAVKETFQQHVQSENPSRGSKQDIRKSIMGQLAGYKFFVAGSTSSGELGHWKPATDKEIHAYTRALWSELREERKKKVKQVDEDSSVASLTSVFITGDDGLKTQTGAWLPTDDDVILVNWNDGPIVDTENAGFRAMILALKVSHRPIFERILLLHLERQCEIKLWQCCQAQSSTFAARQALKGGKKQARH